MDGISAASAILGVAQLGFQFSQVLVTVIGDYRDAAKNINRLRDEINLTSISLLQLSDLAKQDGLREYGILEATNLRERCQATFWEIRSAVRKGDLHPTEIDKNQIDVTYFTAWKWALYTKNKLAEPRQELDRLKDSLTLCFLSHMALLATSDLERKKYTSQIPGIKRSLAWSEKEPGDDYFESKLRAVGICDEKIAQILDREPTKQPIEPAQPDISTTVTEPALPNISVTGTEQPILKAWSLDPLAKTQEIPLSQSWLDRYLAEDPGDKDIWQIQSTLHPWFKDELNNLPLEKTYSWSIVHLKPIFKHTLRKKIPQCVQVVMKGVPPEKTLTQIESRITSQIQAVPYSVEYSMIDGDDQVVVVPVASPKQSMPIADEPSDMESDEEIVAKQLALYQ